MKIKTNADGKREAVLQQVDQNAFLKLLGILDTITFIHPDDDETTVFMGVVASQDITAASGVRQPRLRLHRRPLDRQHSQPRRVLQLGV